MTKTFIVKCKKHFPGYEIIFSNNQGDALEEAKSFRGCDLDLSTLSKDSAMLALDFMKNYREENPKRYNIFMELL